MDVKGNEFHEDTVTVNISSGGAYFLLGNRVDQGASLELVVDLLQGSLDDKVLIKRQGHVVWAEDLMEIEKAGVAVRFERISRFVRGH